jgi:hypothetical protein
MLRWWIIFALMGVLPALRKVFEGVFAACWDLGGSRTCLCLGSLQSFLIDPLICSLFPSESAYSYSWLEILLG